MLNSHPGLPEFDYVKPASLKEASQFLASRPEDARPFAGGTDCFVRMRDGLIQPAFLVDIKGLEGARQITFDSGQGLTLGAGVNMNQAAASPDVLEHYPLLAEAIRTVASYQLRTRATITGNICNASPAGDTLGACLVLNGRLRVHGVDGFRDESLESFFLGPGKTRLKAGDIVTSISFPIPPPGFTGRYIKLGRNQLSDLSIVGVTAAAYPDVSCKSGVRFRIVLASVAPVPLEVDAAGVILAEKPVSEETILQAARAAMQACSPIDDLRASARYRKYMVRNLTRQAVSEVWNRIRPSLPV